MDAALKLASLLAKLEAKLKRAWLKLLKAYCKHKMNKAARLEQKIIQLELELKRDG